MKIDFCTVAWTRGFKLHIGEKWEIDNPVDAILARAANILLEREPS